MLIRLITVSLSCILLMGANEIETSGDCSPVVIENSADINIKCFVDDKPFQWLIRSGKAQLLIDAMKSGLPPRTILQGFVLGGERSFAGIDFFKNVELNELDFFIDELSEHVNLNNRIYINEENYSSIFALAQRSGRSDVIGVLVDAGLAVHSPHNMRGAPLKYLELNEFFPILDMVKSGLIAVTDKNLISSVLENSFVYPPYEEKWSIYQNFRDNIELTNKILERNGLAGQRAFLDMQNVSKLCKLASNDLLP